MPRPLLRTSITLDLHEVDLPEDIRDSAAWLSSIGVRATWFVPSAMLERAEHAAVLRELPEQGHEMASHSHHHDAAEIAALTDGDQDSLRFLERSRDTHRTCVGVAPRSFRAPHWVAPSGLARGELARLGYHVDSSATPTRLPLLSSHPFRVGWLFARRSVSRLVDDLIEIPTSCLFVPAGAPTFLTLRAGSHALMAALLLEARARRDRVVVAQFHVEDLVPASRRNRCPGRFSLRDMWLRPRGGFGFKWFLRERDPQRICALHRSLAQRLASEDCRPLAEWADALSAQAF